jgi:hypothetical protein
LERRWCCRGYEKEGDLEADSFVKAEIIASHLDEGPQMEVPARLFEGPEALLRRIPAGAIQDHEGSRYPENPATVGGERVARI